MAIPNAKTVVNKNFYDKSMLIYGDPKIGKSTFCARLGNDEKEKVLFFSTEAGHKFLSIYEWTNQNGNKPQSWDDFKLCLNEFYKADDYKVLVIDTISNLIRWCEQYILKKHGATDESQGKYGNIFREISREFNTVINKLGQINKGIIFVSHVNLKKEKEGVIYPDLPDKYENLFMGMVDYIFYFHSDKAGNRLIRTKGNDRITSGDRSGNLPELIKLDVEEFRKYL